MMKPLRGKGEHLCDLCFLCVSARNIFLLRASAPPREPLSTVTASRNHESPLRPLRGHLPVPGRNLLPRGLGDSNGRDSFWERVCG